LEQSTTILQRMRDLALQSANGSNSPEERQALNQEVAELKKELDRIANTTSVWWQETAGWFIRCNHLPGGGSGQRNHYGRTGLK
jgi:hypothetical protein